MVGDFPVARIMMVIVREIMSMQMLMPVFMWAGHSCLTHSRRITFALDDDVNFGGSNTTPVHARNFQLGAYIQRRNRLFQNFRRNSGIDQRAEKHVAADAG